MVNKERSDFTPLPDFLFTQVMPQIRDIAELKATICVFYLLHHKRRYPPFVTYGELLPSSTAMLGMERGALQHALELAVKHGSILQLNLDVDGKWQDVYFANMESEREAIDKIKSGELSIKEAVPEEGEICQAIQSPSIFTIYEQNIGILTPMIVEELKEAAKLYPAQWIDEAFKEAVRMNKRSWKYIARILERWSSEGRDSGARRQDIEKGNSDKYIKGKYGHLVKR